MKDLILQLRSLSAGVITLIFAISIIALGLLSWTDVQAQAVGIINTPHNLSSTNTTGPNQNANTADVCVFCHTPHGGDTSASVPLWNKDLSLLGGFTTYDTLGTSSNDGEIAPVGSVSIACLSCHDGVQAMDSMINEPGSGFDSAFVPGVWTQGAGVMTGDAVIGNDLQDDHPIGVQYGGGGITDGALIGPTNDADFVVPGNDLVNGNTIWWVDTEATPNGTRQKTDMQLYTRNDLGSIEPFVECASCHDPHVEDVAGSNPTFLRVSNAGSAVCLACHIK